MAKLTFYPYDYSNSEVLGSTCAATDTKCFLFYEAKWIGSTRVAANPTKPLFFRNHLGIKSIGKKIESNPLFRKVYRPITSERLSYI